MDRWTFDRREMVHRLTIFVILYHLRQINTSIWWYECSGSFLRIVWNWVRKNHSKFYHLVDFLTILWKMCSCLSQIPLKSGLLFCKRTFFFVIRLVNVGELCMIILSHVSKFSLIVLSKLRIFLFFPCFKFSFLNIVLMKCFSWESIISFKSQRRRLILASCHFSHLSHSGALCSFSLLFLK